MRNANLFTSEMEDFRKILIDYKESLFFEVESVIQTFVSTVNDSKAQLLSMRTKTSEQCLSLSSQRTKLNEKNTHYHGVMPSNRTSISKDSSTGNDSENLTYDDVHDKINACNELLPKVDAEYQKANSWLNSIDSAISKCDTILSHVSDCKSNIEETQSVFNHEIDSIIASIDNTIQCCSEIYGFCLGEGHSEMNLSVDVDYLNEFIYNMENEMRIIKGEIVKPENKLQSLSSVWRDMVFENYESQLSMLNDNFNSNISSLDKLLKYFKNLVGLVNSYLESVRF